MKCCDRCGSKIQELTGMTAMQPDDPVLSVGLYTMVGGFHRSDIDLGDKRKQDFLENFLKNKVGEEGGGEE